jgi:transposase
LGGITKRGDVRLRTLLIHGTRSTLRSAAGNTDRKSRWVVNNVAAVALAARHARIIWAMLVRGTEYKVAASSGEKVAED